MIFQLPIYIIKILLELISTSFIYWMVDNSKCIIIKILWLLSFISYDIISVQWPWQWQRTQDKVIMWFYTSFHCDLNKSGLHFCNPHVSNLYPNSSRFPSGGINLIIVIVIDHHSLQDFSTLTMADKPPPSSFWQKKKKN